MTIFCLTYIYIHVHIDIICIIAPFFFFFFSSIITTDHLRCALATPALLSWLSNKQNVLIKPPRNAMIAWIAATQHYRNGLNRSR